MCADSSRIDTRVLLGGVTITAVPLCFFLLSSCVGIVHFALVELSSHAKVNQNIGTNTGYCLSCLQHEVVRQKRKLIESLNFNPILKPTFLPLSAPLSRGWRRRRPRAP